jgi:hypothetical protein
LAAPSHAITIRRAAEILGEDEDLLWDMATDMGPEHGRLWIYDTDDQQTVAFTPNGMDSLREMLPEYNHPRGLERTVTNIRHAQQRYCRSVGDVFRRPFEIVAPRGYRKASSADGV